MYFAKVTRPQVGAITLKKCFLLLVVASWQTCVSAQDLPATEEPESQPQASASFPIPADVTTFSQIMEFIGRIDGMEPPGRSESEVLTHHRKVARTVANAAEKALKTKLTDDELMQSVFYKLQAIRLLSQMKEPGADKELSQAIDQALGDKRPTVKLVGTKFLIEHGFGEWNHWREPERKAWADRLSNVVLGSKPSGEQLQMLLNVLDYLGDMEGDVYAKELLAKVVPHYRQTDNKRLLEHVVLLEGIARRLDLPGKKMELEGELLDGSTLDWSQYRGKVVLVDFWATWCRPCRAEIPNVLAMYEAYHEKGFDVLGISLDATRAQAESYIKQANLPWRTLFSSQEEQRSWQHPMAMKYGITGIPRAILVDREGKVVNMNARGRILVHELRRLLGEPIARKNLEQDALVRNQTGE